VDDIRLQNKELWESPSLLMGIHIFLKNN
jgi:hypothetical protein